jgi:hypothetical protein
VTGAKPAAKECDDMKKAKSEREPAKLGRRAFLRTLGGGAIGGGVVGGSLAGPLTGEARALPTSYQDRRKSEYQANSPEVQDFYRVNRYPSK